jgi:hypothetical protein
MKPLEKPSHGRSRRRWDDNFKTDVKGRSVVRMGGEWTMSYFGLH